MCPGCSSRGVPWRQRAAQLPHSAPGGAARRVAERDARCLEDVRRAGSGGLRRQWSAARMPRLMPAPWSPSPATESRPPELRLRMQPPRRPSPRARLDDARGGIGGRTRPCRPRPIGGGAPWSEHRGVRGPCAPVLGPAPAGVTLERNPGVAMAPAESGSRSSVEPAQRQRAPRHVQGGHEFAHLGVDQLDALTGEPRPRPSRYSTNSSSYLVAPRPFKQDARPDRAVRPLRQQLVHEDVREPRRGHPVDQVDARLAVDAEARARSGPARPGTMARCGPGTCSRRTRRRTCGSGCWRVARCARPSARRIAPTCGRGRGAEHPEAACDAPAVLRPGRRGARDHVVGDQHDADVDALRTRLLRGEPEVHHIAAVVAEREQDAGAAIERPDGPIRLRRPTGW